MAPKNIVSGAVIGFLSYVVVCFGVGAFYGFNIPSALDKRLEHVAPFVMVGFISLGAVISAIISSLQHQAALNEEERKRRRASEEQAQQERNRAAAELERQKQLQRQERERVAAELERKKQELAALLATTRREFLTIPELVPSADMDLDQAEVEFADGALNPFWDEIEKATNKLAAYNEAVLRISRNAEDYERDSANLGIPTEKFSLPKRGLPDARPVAQRLSSIVRLAQTNTDFTLVYNQRAQIYEQRKTNELLFAGFSSLRQAISSLGRTISSSLQKLSRSIHVKLEDILQAQRDHTDAMEANARRQEQAERDRQEVEQERYEEQKGRDEERDAGDAEYQKEDLKKKQEQTEIDNARWRGKKPPDYDPYPRNPHR